MRRLSRWLLMLVLGAVIGAGSLAYMVYRVDPGAIVQNGIWRVDLETGSPHNDPYARLRIALTMLLTLRRDDMLYFQADRDADGAPLTGACDYVLSGPPPAARWWSLTAYGAGGYLIQTATARYSTNTATATLDSDGEAHVVLTPDGAGPDGIATGSGRFMLVLRLLEPAKAVRDAPEAVPLFKLVKTACRA